MKAVGFRGSVKAMEISPVASIGSLGITQLPIRFANLDADDRLLMDRQKQRPQLMRDEFSWNQVDRNARSSLGERQRIPIPRKLIPL